MRPLTEQYTLIRNATDEAFTADELAEALTQADAVCPTVTDGLTADVFAAAAQKGIRAKLLANFGVGYNHIDLASAQTHGLSITNTPGVLTAATAEMYDVVAHVRASYWGGRTPSPQW